MTSITHLCLLILGWVKSNPVLAWGIISCLISLLYTKLEAYPRAHAVLSLLAGWGLDLPTILNAGHRVITGTPPTKPPMGPYRTVGSTSPPTQSNPPTSPPTERRIEKWWQTFWAGLGLAIFYIGIMAGCSNCAWFKANSKQVATDVSVLVECVTQKEALNEPPSEIATECGLTSAGDVIKLIASMDRRTMDRFHCTQASYLEYVVSPNDAGDW